jgi:hypothetical protein
MAAHESPFGIDVALRRKRLMNRQSDFILRGFLAARAPANLFLTA